MKLSLQFWAKLGNEEWPEKYHPVICHLIDVAAVTLNLWYAVFRPRFRGWLTRHLGLDEESCARWLAFWCGAHDIGKVSPDFQAKGKSGELKTQLEKAGFNFTHSGGEKSHGEVGTAVLATELIRGKDWPAIHVSVARDIAVAVGGHHGIFPTDWDSIHGPLGNDHWETARHIILAKLAWLLGIPNLPSPQPPSSRDQSVWMCVAGLTSVADWIGSNQEFFKPKGCPAMLTNGFDLNEYFQYARTKAHEALEVLGWLGGEAAGSVRTFKDLFAGILPGEPRPLQRIVEDVAQRMTTPALLIVEAPMGEGKTEAAWFVADTWEQRGGQGNYVALPTMATSNQMFKRVGRFLKAGTGKKNVMLLHGKSALNDRFKELKYTAQMYDDEKHPSAVVAEEWFAANKKHGLLAPYGVGTIDQALLAVLQTKHVFVRLFGLAGKCVILDEVHAYDAYMTTLMERLLRWLAALGCPVVLLSATLPKEKRLKLLRAYAGDNLPEPEDKPYPRLTSVAVGDERAEVHHIKADPERAQTIKLGWLEEGNLAETLRQALANGGCAAVIRNTVGLAQGTYLQLRDALKADGIEVELFHARFPFGRRDEIEKGVLKRFGKHSSPAERNKRVLVATQVVEQSLDLDFDMMVSDVAPVDLVLQRAGRLHRHARGQRPAGVSEPQLWLIEAEMKEGLPDFKSYDKIYARFILLRSHIALKSVQMIRLPDDLEHFIEQVYGTEPLTIPEGWQTALDECEKKLREHQETKRLFGKKVHEIRPLS